LFAWVHLHSPHHPYVKHPGGPDFGSDDAGRYDSEIYESDQALSALLPFLQESEKGRQTAVILTSDHGEELWDHGGTTHNGDSLHREEIQVPLMVYHPRFHGRRAVTWIEQPASHRDLTPTIAELLGACDYQLPGRSLLPALAGEVLPEPPRGFAVGPRGTFGSGLLIEGRWKLGFVLFNDSVDLFDLETDRNDRVALSELGPDVGLTMKRKLHRYLDDPWTDQSQAWPWAISPLSPADIGNETAPTLAPAPTDGR